MTHQAPRADERDTSVEYPYTVRAKAAQTGEHVSRWLLGAAIFAAAAIFWTLAADSFTSV
jgi:hypothetical protein